MMMISIKVTRDNHLGVPAQYCLFDSTSSKKSDLDKDGRIIVSTISRLYRNYVITSLFLHRIRKVKSGRYKRY